MLCYPSHCAVKFVKAHLIEHINPLLHTGHYCVRMTKILNLKKKKGSSKKISYERRVYDSVDDSSLSYAISQKNDEKKKTHATKG